MPGDVVIRPLGRPGDLGWVVMAHGEVYADEFGWDSAFETLAAQIVADFAAPPSDPREAAWIAERDRERLGCVFVVQKEPLAAQLRVLLVHPSARGQQIGQQLVETAIGFARSAGYARLVLWTNHPLAAARRIYVAAGFRLINEEPHHSFGVDLVGQFYELSLEAVPARPNEPKP
jgi:GNAT superfamily N-acetyltransferase